MAALRVGGRVAVAAALAAAASLALIALLLAAGCGDAADGGRGGPDAGSGIEVIAGNADTGGQGFLLKQDGDDADLIPGAQGGFHVWISLRVHGAAGTLYVVHEARRVRDDALILRGNRFVLDVPAAIGDDWWESPSASPAFMCPSPLGIQVFDEEVRFSVELRDTDDVPVARDDLVLVPRCPTDGQHDFCIEICSG